MKKFLKEFRDFAIKGNMISMAVGIVIGSAFTALVAQVNESFISPLLSIFLKNSSLAELSFTIGQGTFLYGKFIQSVINFIITAFVLFLIVKAFNKVSSMTQSKDKPDATTKTCPYCRSEIDIKATRCPHCTSEQPDGEAL